MYCMCVIRPWVFRGFAQNLMGGQTNHGWVGAGPRRELLHRGGSSPPVPVWARERDGTGQGATNTARQVGSLCI